MTHEQLLTRALDDLARLREDLLRIEDKIDRGEPDLTEVKSVMRGTAVGVALAIGAVHGLRGERPGLG